MLGVPEKNIITNIENDTGIKEYDWVEQAEAEFINPSTVVLDLNRKTLESCRIELPLACNIINSNLGKVDITKSYMTRITHSHVRKLHLPKIKNCRSTGAIQVTYSNIDELYIIDRYSVDSYNMISMISTRGNNTIKQIYSKYPLIATGGGILLITHSCMDIVKKHGLEGKIKENAMIAFIQERERIPYKCDIPIDFLVDIVNHLSTIKDFGASWFHGFKYHGYNDGWFTYKKQWGDIE